MISKTNFVERRPENYAFPLVVAHRFTEWKVSKYRVFSGRYFPAFGLNKERYFVSLCIQSECGKIRTEKKLRIWALFTQWLQNPKNITTGNLNINSLRNKTEVVGELIKKMHNVFALFFVFCFFFSIRVFFHRHWRFTGQQGREGDQLLFHSTTSTRLRTLRHLFAILHVRCSPQLNLMKLFPTKNLI